MATAAAVSARKSARRAHADLFLIRFALRAGPQPRLPATWWGCGGSPNCARGPTPLPGYGDGGARPGFLGARPSAKPMNLGGHRGIAKRGAGVEATRAGV